MGNIKSAKSIISSCLKGFLNERCKKEKSKNRDFLVSFLDELKQESLYIVKNYPRKTLEMILSSSNEGIDNKFKPSSPMFSGINFSKSTKEVLCSLQ